MSDDLERTNLLNARIREKILHHLPHPRILPTAIEGFLLARREAGGTPEKCFEKPLVGLVVQGTKHSHMGGREYVYSTNQSIVAAVDMPISSYVEDPTPERPFLFCYCYLDKALLASLAAEMPPADATDADDVTGVSIADTPPDILEMFLRLLELLDKPEQIPFRAPMMLRELHYLLLISPHGRILRKMNTPGTPNHQAVQAVNWIRQNYKSTLRIATLARQVNMSTANLHRCFKLLTGLSPLQYQKQLRLYEAQRLMLFENERASAAAFKVGYESITQFNREYKRVFGEPPLRDMHRRRALAAGSGLSAAAPQLPLCASCGGKEPAAITEGA